ncbi:MAG TPA: bifunctional hydroxymethylpyrimidine kinase/phosphomethylpyrimidine kinase [Longimicrobium sp.]|jgi:hydroxymethylpyrimidine/phosphomethylpyrimidine kinase|uniref:bifunctional hydroxymethylpyrimidine kinase/phosphomethylpyrimidine kinase n=1 Tax=Longimicrobium sp. TaxID=2029185 RepID=UPI002EDB5A07
MTATPPITLTIAGSDSGGGAGIQADLKTFQAFGCFGTSAITAITVQNTLGVTGVHSIPVETVRAQIAALADDLPPAACKSGMLATSELVRAVAQSIREHRLPNYVLDPVMVATSGHRLLDEDAQRTIVEELLPLAAVVTPNLDEAALLVGFAVDDPDAMRRAAQRLVQLGAGAALLKGGHLQADELVDLLWDGREWHEWRHPKMDTRSTHGTGCTLSAGIAAGLAHGRPLARAVGDALDFVQRAMRTAPGLGAGHGPLNHMAPGPAAG